MSKDKPRDLSSRMTAVRAWLVTPVVSLVILGLVAMTIAPAVLAYVHHRAERLRVIG